MQITTAATYYSDLEQMEQSLHIREMGGEFTKNAQDALNNAWCEGMTMAEWAEAAKERFPHV